LASNSGNRGEFHDLHFTESGSRRCECKTPPLPLLPSTGGLGGKEERRMGPGGRERGIK